MYFGGTALKYSRLKFKVLPGVPPKAGALCHYGIRIGINKIVIRRLNEIQIIESLFIVLLDRKRRPKYISSSAVIIPGGSGLDFTRSSYRNGH